jgi:hypothetical protein
VTGVRSGYNIHVYSVLSPSEMLRISVFRLSNAFKCFLRSSEQTAFISFTEVLMVSLYNRDGVCSDKAGNISIQILKI